MIFVLGLLLAACGSKQVRPNLNEAGRVFPSGSYKQKIKVNYVKDEKKEENSFNAVLKTSPQEISMYCYVGFGFTLFKLKDNLKDAPTFEAGDARIEKNKEFFLKMYPVIKQVLQLSKSDPRLGKDPFTIFMKPENFPVDIQISPKKVNGVPESLVFENKEHFRFFIETTDFTPL